MFRHMFSDGITGQSSWSSTRFDPWFFRYPPPHAAPLLD